LIGEAYSSAARSITDNQPTALLIAAEAAVAAEDKVSNKNEADESRSRMVWPRCDFLSI